MDANVIFLDRVLGRGETNLPACQLLNQCRHEPLEVVADNHSSTQAGSLRKGWLLRARSPALGGIELSWRLPTVLPKVTQFLLVPANMRNKSQQSVSRKQIVRI
jgi:hypothetical protein